MIPVWRAAGHRRMPWKNGGGVTTEIAVFPNGAGLEDFDWRVSTALVASDGPFSAFPGIDRMLTILDGEGLLLAIGDQPPVELRAGSAPFSFPADHLASARLIGGPVTDLNVMTRRGRFAHRVRRIATSAREVALPDAAISLLLCASGSVTLKTSGRHVIGLDAMDMADLSGLGAGAAIEGSDASLFLIELLPSA